MNRYSILFVIILFIILTFFVSFNWLRPDNTINQEVLQLKVKEQSSDKIEKDSDEVIIYKKRNKNNKDKNPIIIAVFGTDERANEKSRSDTIMLIKYSPIDKKAIIVSIPRDSRVKIPGKWVDKINAAHAFGGPDLQKKTIESLFNTRIDYYIKVNFDGFIKIIDIIEGVEVNSEKDMIKDKKTNQFLIRKGPQVLKGEQALEYVRFRNDMDGDFGRIKRQQEVLLSIAKKIFIPNNLYKLPIIAQLIKTNIVTDISIFQALNLVREVRNINSITIETYTLKTQSKKIDGIWYEIVNEEDLKILSEKLNR